MNNSTTNLPKNQTETYESRRDLLEQNKLSRLPERRPFRLPDFSNTPSPATISAVCAGCAAKLDCGDVIQQRFNGCLKCVGIYGRLDAAADDYDKRKRKEMLERMLGGGERNDR